jgi:hypothetical protein
MKRVLFRTCAVGAAALSAFSMPSYATNLVVNGSFELGNFDDIDIGGHLNVTQIGGNQSYTKITGWTSSANEILWIDNAYTAGSLKTIYDSKFLDLTAYTNVVSRYGSIGQNVATTANTTYTLSFSLGSSNQFGPLPVVAVSTAGVTVSFATTAIPVALSNWTVFSYTFTALSASTPITFTGIQGSDYIGLDNIAVMAVPEPSSITLMFAGLGIIGSVAIRRRQQR